MAKRLKWGTIEYLNTLIDEYFATEPLPSITGLRLHLGISDNCWRYYVSETWKTHRKSEEEIEEIAKNQPETDANEAFEELMEISSNSIISEYDGKSMNIEEDNIKRLVSLALKKAKDRIDIFVGKQIFTAKNPAGAIFYAKAALGYRETAPEADPNQQALPSKINILIMSQPPKPQQFEAIEVTPLEVSGKA
jgi:hypothetical protein